MPEYVLSMRGDHLAPEIQPGDHIAVRTANTGQPGQLAVVKREDGTVTVERYETGDVQAIVTHVYGERS